MRVGIFILKNWVFFWKLEKNNEKLLPFVYFFLKIITYNFKLFIAFCLFFNYNILMLIFLRKKFSKFFHPLATKKLFRLYHTSLVNACAWATSSENMIGEKFYFLYDDRLQMIFFILKKTTFNKIFLMVNFRGQKNTKLWLKQPQLEFHKEFFFSFVFIIVSAFFCCRIKIEKNSSEKKIYVTISPRTNESSYMRVKNFITFTFSSIFMVQKQQWERAKIAIWWSFKRWTNWKTSFSPTTTHMTVWNGCAICASSCRMRIAFSSG